MTKAVLLLSGGLDSTLAGKLLAEQGVEVTAVNFVSPFCRCTPASMGCSAARRAATQLGIEVKAFAAGEDYLSLVKKPRFGRGANMNPCLDCRVHIFKLAGKYMREIGAEFIVTGEVLGERPMSQRRHAMELIEKHSGLAGLIVRPLSAGLLKPSMPENDGKVDRSLLKSIQGRRRLPQMNLARELGIDDYLCPAGGCLLTDPEFAARLRELFDHEPECDMADVRLLKVGRHFRLQSGAKAVVGRNEDENLAIERAWRNDDFLIQPGPDPGPTVLLRGGLGTDDETIAAGLMLAYMKHGPEVEAMVRMEAGPSSVIRVRGELELDKSVVERLRVTGKTGKKGDTNGGDNKDRVVA